MCDYAASRREVVNLFRGFFGEATERDTNFLPQGHEGVFIFLGVRFLVFGDLRFRYKRSSLSLCCWPLFSLFSGALSTFSRWSSLDIRHSTLAFSCSLSSSPRCVLPILRPIKPHFAFFSTLSLWSLFLSLFPVYFHSRSFLRELFLTAVNYFHPALKYIWEISDTSLASLQVKVNRWRSMH